MGILQLLSDAIVSLNGIFWGWMIAGILLLTGVFYTVSLRFPQIKYFPKLFSSLKSNFKSEGGGVSGFGALCAAVGGQVGTGSLVGVASAIVAGGPGAVFWMWMTALLGMAISFGEAILGLLFRAKNSDGTYRGGAAYYMEKGMKCKPLAVGYSMLMIVSVGLFVAMIQSNSIASSFQMVINVPPIILGIIIGTLTGIVIIGGVKRLSEVSSLIVPFMAAGYILITLFILISHIAEIPSVIALIFKSAFSTHAAVGGVMGYTIKEAFRNGVARGLFSNDAGNGAAAGMHASAQVKHPAAQGFCAMLGTFLTTIIICSCTAFAILLTGVANTGYDGINLVQAAFSSAIGVAGNWIVMIAMVMFGFTTLLADVYYGEVNIKFAFGEQRAILIWLFRIFAIALIVLSTIIPLNVLWNLVDFMSALIVFANVVALWKMQKYVRYVFNDYVKQSKEGVAEPEWNYDSDITKIG